MCVPRTLTSAAMSLAIFKLEMASTMAAVRSRLLAKRALEVEILY